VTIGDASTIDRHASTRSMSRAIADTTIVTPSDALRHHAESRARLARHCPPEAPHAKPGEEIEVRRPNGEFESFDAARGRARARERRGEATRAKTDDRASGRADEGRETVLRGGASGGETVAGRGGGVERGARGEREDEKGGKGTEASNGDRGG
jgi:hypothetical protein